LVVDLEPYFSCAVPVVAARAGAFGHVDHDGGGAVRPLGPSCFDLFAGGYGG
jgi:hypothetical protein